MPTQHGQQLQKLIAPKVLAKKDKAKTEKEKMSGKNRATTSMKLKMDAIEVNIIPDTAES